MTDDHTFYERPRLEWVHHEFLVGVLRERDEAEARAVQAEARAVQAEALAAAALELLEEYTEKLLELTMAAVATVEGDADGLDRLKELVGVPWQ